MGAERRQRAGATTRHRGARLAALLLFLPALAGAQAPAVPESVASAALRDYVIGPGDLLQVEIFELEELSKTVRVTGDGAVTYPMLGPVQVAGMTKRQVEEKLARLLADRYVRDPQVTVFVKEMQSGKVSVMGAVHQPGGFPLVGSRAVLDLLSLAGGVTKEAGKRLFLVRAGTTTPVVIDLKKLMEEADLRLNLEVTPGDVLYVPMAKPTRVYVYGQVERPGVFEVQEGEPVTVLQAVSMAGGLGRRASAGKTKIVRGGQDGKRITRSVDLNRVIAGKEPDPKLEDGDIVVVPKSFF